MKTKSADTQKNNPKQNIFKRLISAINKIGNMFKPSKKINATHPSDKKDKTNPNIQKDNEPNVTSKIKWSNIIAGLAFIASCVSLCRNERSITVAEKSVEIADSSKVYAKQSANAADTSAEVAKKSLSRQDTSNEISRGALMVSERSYESSIIMNQKALEAQIQSLRETQKQFQIENRPFLQVGNIFFDSIIPDKPKKVFYTLENLGNYPAKIVKTKSTFVIRKEDKNSYDIHHKPNLGSSHQFELNEYIVKGSPLKKDATYGVDSNVISQERYNAIKDGILLIYLVGSVTYVNLADTTKKTRYEFMIECNIKEKTIKYKYNENIEYK